MIQQLKFKSCKLRFLTDGHPDNDRDDDNRSQFLDDDNLGNLSDGDLADSFNSDEPSKIELTKQELSQLQIVTHGMNNSGYQKNNYLFGSIECFTDLGKLSLVIFCVFACGGLSLGSSQF